MVGAFNRARKERIELDGREAFFRMRSQWSWVLIIWISVFITFHITLTFLVGAGVLNFEKYVWLIPTITGENFLQIVGMGYIVVKFLYPEGETSPSGEPPSA
jgi:predicted CDP-diglyceride synthetase/phosphatidate cytidylyltransferase